MTPSSSRRSREELRKRLLRGRVHARRRLVEREQRRLRSEGARDEGPLLHAAGERAQRRGRAIPEADAVDRLRHSAAIVGMKRAERASDGKPPRLDGLPHRDGRPGRQLGALGDVRDARRSTRTGVEAKHPHGAAHGPLEPQRESQKRCLAAAVRPRDAEKRALLDAKGDVLERGRAASIRERDAVQLERGHRRRHRQPSAICSAARLSRITSK